MTATVVELGTYAVGYDTTPPNITVDISNTARTISNPVPIIHAVIADEGVGVDSATVQMRLDGIIVPARFVTATGQLIIAPIGYDMTVPHTVEIHATDTAGNSALRRLQLNSVTSKSLYNDYKTFLPSVMRSP